MGPVDLASMRLNGSTGGRPQPRRGGRPPLLFASLLPIELKYNDVYRGRTKSDLMKPNFNSDAMAEIQLSIPEANSSLFRSISECINVTHTALDITAE